MADESDWSVTTWEGNRRQQHRDHLALSFREKLVRLEQMEQFASVLAPQAREPRRALDRTEEKGLAQQPNPDAHQHGVQ